MMTKDKIFLAAIGIVCLTVIFARYSNTQERLAKIQKMERIENDQR